MKRFWETKSAEPTEFHCPFCQSAIAAEDVNVATDLALCRACGRTSAFALVAGASNISLDCLDSPPKGIRISRNLQGGTKVVYRRVSPALFFLVPFTAFWSGGSMAVIYGSQIRKGVFDLHQSLAGLPFLLGTVILVSIILFCAFGRWEVIVQQGQGSVFVGLGSFGWRRRFTYDHETTILLRLTSIQVNDVAQRGICVRTDDQEFVFGTLIKEPAKQFMAAAILRAVADLR